MHGRHQGRLTRVAFCNEQGQPTQVFKQGEVATFYYEFELNKDIGVPIGSIEITNAYSILIHSKNSLQYQLKAPSRVHAESHLRFCQKIGLGLEPGEYAFTLGLLTIHPDDYANLNNLTQEDLNEKMVWVCRQVQAGAFVVTFGLGQGKALLHGGLCDLPGDCQVELLENRNEMIYEQTELQPD